MKIAVASHKKSNRTDRRGRCRKSWIYEANSPEILGKELLELLKERSFHNSFPHDDHPLDDVQVLISGGIGCRLICRLEEQGIEAVVIPESDPDISILISLKHTPAREIAKSHNCRIKNSHQHNRQYPHGQA